MTSSYDDLSSPSEMLADGRATGDRLRLEQAVRRAARPAPSLYFDEQPAEQGKRQIRIDEAAARLAAAVHFHLD